MGGWDAVLFERRVLSWVSGLSLLGMLMWVVALATPYWTIHVYPLNHFFVWGYTGLFITCDLRQHPGGPGLSSTEMEVLATQGPATPLIWECFSNLASREPSIKSLARSEIALSVAALLVNMASFGFGAYSLYHPLYVYKRLAAVLYIATAACVLSVLKLCASRDHTVARGGYGISYLFGWCAAIASAACGFAFLVYSRKRKLLESDNLAFSHQRLSFRAAK